MKQARPATVTNNRVMTMNVSGSIALTPNKGARVRINSDNVLLITDISIAAAGRASSTRSRLETPYPRRIFLSNIFLF
jgi:hypothetical protein